MQDQKDIRRDKCIDFLESTENDPHFLECVITWLLEYNLETKCQSMERHTPSSPWPKKKQEWANQRSKACWCAFLTARESFTKNLCLHAKGLINTFTKRFLKDYLILVNSFLASKNIPVASQPHSPDLSPCDFFLFPRLKTHLKELCFGAPDNIQTAVTNQLKAIPVSEFQHCYEECKTCPQCCVVSQGRYRVIQIICAHTDGCRWWPWRARCPVSGPS